MQSKRYQPYFITTAIKERHHLIHLAKCTRDMIGILSGICGGLVVRHLWPSHDDMHDEMMAKKKKRTTHVDGDVDCNF